MVSPSNDRGLSDLECDGRLIQLVISWVLRACYGRVQHDAVLGNFVDRHPLTAARVSSSGH
jgi:hypothetical protein